MKDRRQPTDEASREDALADGRQSEQASKSQARQENLPLTSPPPSGKARATRRAEAWEDVDGYLHPTDAPGDVASIAGEFTHSGLTPESYRKRL